MLYRLHPLPVLLVLLALVAALRPLTQRYRVERRNRAVEMVVDLNQVRALATATGHSPHEALADAKRSGATGAAVTEQLLQDLVNGGRLRVAEARGESIRIEVSTPEPELSRRIQQNLLQRLPGLAAAAAVKRGAQSEVPREVRFTGPGVSLRLPHAGWADLATVPVGLDPQEIALVRGAGLDPVGRVYSFLGAAPDSIDAVLRSARDQGVHTLVFAGEEVLGFQGLLGATRDALERYDLLFGWIEFGKQRGDDALAERTQDRLVRVHSIAAGETARLNEDEAVERYVRAVSERNIRLCYIRLISSVSAETYVDNWRYVNRIVRGVVDSGYLPGRAHALGEVGDRAGPERWTQALLGAGCGASGLLLLASVLPIRRRRQAMLTVLFAACGSLALIAGGHRGQQVVALATACVFPTLAFVWFPQPVGAFGAGRIRCPAPLIAPALREFVLMCGVSAMGALLVAALLSQRDYMLKVDAFAGIKLAHVFPVAAVAAFYLFGLNNRQSWSVQREFLSARLRQLVAEPLRLWHLVAMAVGGAALILLVLRTGNEPGIGVSPLEMRFRALLEEHLVRPRTKEFLLGHPALLVGLGLAGDRRWYRCALPLLLVGAIGQASIVNSFCHIHTPLLTSAWRTFNGIWIGAGIGTVVLLLARLIDRCLPEGNAVD